MAIRDSPQAAIHCRQPAAGRPDWSFRIVVALFLLRFLHMIIGDIHAEISGERMRRAALGLDHQIVGRRCRLALRQWLGRRNVAGLEWADDTFKLTRSCAARFKIDQLGNFQHRCIDLIFRREIIARHRLDLEAPSSAPDSS